MTKQERETVDYWRKISRVSNITKVNAIPALLEIIDRLDKQLAEIKEAGEPFAKTEIHKAPDIKDGETLYLRVEQPLDNVLWMWFSNKSEFRRLAEKLKEVNCD